MSDSQQPPPPMPSFEVPDLEPEPSPRTRVGSVTSTQGTPVAPPSPPGQLFGASFDFGDGDGLEDFELERTAQPSVQGLGMTAPRRAATARVEKTVEAGPSWPTGCALDADTLAIDPLELATLANYGAPPDAPPHTLAYAYRVFMRQRELKRALIPIAAEQGRAALEREATLAELASALRPALETKPEFRRFLAPIVELDQRAAERGRALTSINAGLGAESGKLDAELAQIENQIQAEQTLERDAERKCDELKANVKRTDAKLKRVQIEVRAVTHVAEQKLGAQGGQLPEAEAAQLSGLQQRAESMQPELAQARAEFDRAKEALGQLRARLAALRQSERQITRHKHTLGGEYHKQLLARTQGDSESEIERRAALSDLGRAVLAARGTVDVPEEWLERVRGVSERANTLTVRAEMQRRAISAYDIQGARQGVRLACTAVGLVLVLFAFKLIF